VWYSGGESSNSWSNSGRRDFNNNMIKRARSVEKGLRAIQLLTRTKRVVRQGKMGGCSDSSKSEETSLYCLRNKWTGGTNSDASASACCISPELRGEDSSDPVSRTTPSLLGKKNASTKLRQNCATVGSLALRHRLGQQRKKKSGFDHRKPQTRVPTTMQ